jgi:hypothetical protein
MNLGEIVDYANVKLGKDMFGGYVTPDQLNDSLLEAANYDLLNKYVSVYEKDRIVTDDIRPFVKTLGDTTFAPLPLDAAGFGVLPNDYIGYTDIFVMQYTGTCDDVQQNPRLVEMLNRDRFAYRRTSGVLRPRVQDPIGTIQNNKLYVLPVGFQNCVFSYIRKPVQPYFDYDIINDEFVYLPPGQVHANSSVEPVGSPSLSVEFEWPEQMHEELGDYLVKYFATNFRSEFNLGALDINKPSAG